MRKMMVSSPGQGASRSAAAWCLVFWGLLGPTLQARELVIGGIPEKPLRWVAPDGTIVGFDVEVMDCIMKKLQRDYRIELVDSSARLERNAREQPSPYDMVFTFSHTNERQSFLWYAKESHISFNWNFFLRKEDEGKFSFNSYADLAPWTIGITRGMSYSDEFLRAIETVPLKVDQVATNKLQLDKLLARRFDLVPLNTKATLYEARERGILERISYLPKPVKDKAYFNTFVKNSSHPELQALIPQYDAALRQMRSDGTLAHLMIKYGFMPPKAR